MAFVLKKEIKEGGWLLFWKKERKEIKEGGWLGFCFEKRKKRNKRRRLAWLLF